MISRSCAFILFITLFVGAFQGKTQTISRSTLGMAGSSQVIQSKGHSYFISQSIGQASVTGTFTRKGKVLRQGFQQPPGGIKVGPIKNEDLKAVIYPNPTDQIINIRLMDQSLRECSIELIDYSGRLLYQARYDIIQPISLDLAEYPSGVYLLKIMSNEKFSYTPVIKQ